MTTIKKALVFIALAGIPGVPFSYLLYSCGIGFALKMLGIVILLAVVFSPVFVIVHWLLNDDEDEEGDRE